MLVFGNPMFMFRDAHVMSYCLLRSCLEFQMVGRSGRSRVFARDPAAPRAQVTAPAWGYTAWLGSVHRQPMCASS